MIETILARLRRLALDFEEWERPTFHEPLDAGALSELERSAGPLRADMLRFLQSTAQIVAMDIHNGYWIGGRVLLSPRPDDGWPHRLTTPAGEIRVVAIATDGGGNAFLMSPEAGTVWSWDHGTGRTEEVAESFTHFLTRVAEDWERYAANDHDWRYLVSPPRRDDHTS